MTVSQKVIDILNKDEVSRKLNTVFQQAAKEEGLTGEEYQEAHKTFIMMCIARNPEAIELMADEIWEEVNGGVIQ